MNDSNTYLFVRNPEDLINNGQLAPVPLDAGGEQRRPDDVVSVINSAFNNRPVRGVGRALGNYICFILGRVSAARR